MPAVDTCTWDGASGTPYTYHVHSLPQTFDPNQNGNYIFTKLVDNLWSPIYIGQGDLEDRVGSSHHKWSCITSKGATHVHVHLNSSLQNREAEEEDLLQNYQNAYAPSGCNERIGG